MSDTEILQANNLFNVNGMVAVITGGGSGIGLMFAKALALNGAHKVYILGRTLETLQAASKASPYDNIIPVQADVTSKESLEAAASRIQAETGHINLLIANAGTAAATLQGVPKITDAATFKSVCWNLDQADFARVYEMNLTAVFFTTVAFVELLDAGNKARNYGQFPDVILDSQVVIISSIAGHLKRPPTVFAYSSSKAAVEHMALNLGNYLNPLQIRVNVIAPGVFPSVLAKDLVKIWPGGKIPKDVVPAGRVGTEPDMAGTLLYLVSRAGAFTDGNVIMPDGGRVKLGSEIYRPD